MRQSLTSSGGATRMVKVGLCTRIGKEGSTVMRTRDVGRQWGMAATLLALVATGAAGHVGAVASGGGAPATGTATGSTSW